MEQCIQIKDDSGVPGMTENPDFHGLYERRHSGNEEVNYLASYRFMIKIRKRNTEKEKQ